MLELFKDGDCMGIRTDCTSPEEFLDQLSKALDGLIEARVYDHDWYFQLDNWLPMACECWAKLKGYKSDVQETRVIYAGAIKFSHSVVEVDDRDTVLVDGVSDLDARAQALVAGIDAVIGSPKNGSK